MQTEKYEWPSSLLLIAFTFLFVTSSPASPSSLCLSRIASSARFPLEHVDMSGRGQGQRGGGGDRGGRGGGRGGRGGHGQSDQPERKREAILDLSKYADKRVRVKFNGGREVEGTLKGWDQLLNLVLDDVEELVRDPATLQPITPNQKRNVGLAVIRGTSLVVINPVDGFESIENPFANPEE